MVILARAISIALLLVLAVRPALAADWQCGRNAGSDEGGRRAAAIYTLIQTAKLNDIDPQAWLADVLARLPDHPAKRIDELLPWNWRPQTRSCLIRSSASERPRLRRRRLCKPRLTN
jgi:hypothetical protein